MYDVVMTTSHYNGSPIMMSSQHSEGDDITVIPERLRAMLVRRNMTPADLARATGVHKSTISLMLSSKRSSTTTTNVGKIALALGVSVDYLLGLSDTPEPSSLQLGDLLFELTQVARNLPAGRQRDLLAMANSYLDMYQEQKGNPDKLMEELLDLVEQHFGEKTLNRLIDFLEGKARGNSNGITFLLGGQE